MLIEPARQHRADVNRPDAVCDLFQARCSWAHSLAACCGIPELLLLGGTPMVSQVSGNQVNGSVEELGTPPRPRGEIKRMARMKGLGGIRDAPTTVRKPLCEDRWATE